MFQTRLGRKIIKASAPPTHSQRLASLRRSPVNSKPKTMPAPKISIEYLFSSPNPDRMPNQIHSLVLPVLIIRISR